MIVMTVTIIKVADESNKTAARQQMHRLAVAVESELTKAQIELAMVASGHPAKFGIFGGNAGQEPFSENLEAAWTYFNFDEIYALDGRNGVVTGSSRGAPAGTLTFASIRPHVAHLVARVAHNRVSSEHHGQHRLLSPEFEKVHGASGLIQVRGGLALAAVVPFNPAQPWADDKQVLVAARMLDAAKIADLGRRHGLDNVRFQHQSAGDSTFAIPVTGAGETRIGHLAWDHFRPGSDMLPNLLLIVLTSVITIAIAFGVLFERLRRLGREMTKEEEKSNLLASHDHLSGLLNRRTFHERFAAELERCRRGHAGMALHMIDLDRFKDINDSLGHQAGDEVIRQVAQRISNVVRGADIVARLGGDEFAVVQVDTETTLEATALAERLREALTRPIMFGDSEMSVGASIGIALGPVGELDTEGMLKLADSALYEAKSGGRNRHRFFEHDGSSTNRMKQLVEEELRDAINNDHLELHYQPQVSADGLRILGVEALVRWRHPIRGLIPPLDFIALAEQRGLIVPLSKWVLKRACLDGRRWSGIKVAVNVSAAQFKQSGFVRDLIETVEATGFDLSRLELELTEGMIVEDEDKAERAISELREQGVSLALDDFGTGYSSLIYLRRFSFDKIKIDRSFLEAMETTGESAILLHSVVHLGRALGLSVCAEGIETQEQHRFLQAVGCHELQGYFFSRPVLASEIDDMLARAVPFPKAA